MNPKSLKAKGTWRSKNIKDTKAKQYDLGKGDKGFLCSCNGQEKQCVRESYNILNKYADKIYGEAVSEQNVSDVLKSAQTSSGVEIDLDEQFERELQSLRKGGETCKRFQVVNSGAKNLLFIRTTVEDPVTLVSHIIKDLHQTQKLQTRYLIRLVPIEVTCKANVGSIKEACAPLLDKHFNDIPKSFSIIYNHRKNNNLPRDEVIKAIAELIEGYSKGHMVSLYHADVSVIVEVIKGIALLAVIPQYLQYKKFNLHALCDQNSGINSDEVCNVNVAEITSPNMPEIK